jgi:hypothetical protein
MNGRDVLFILAHLFRKKGNPVTLDDAVEFLSFQCRYGRPSDIRRMFALAMENGMLSHESGALVASFQYHEQELPLNLTARLGGRVNVRESIVPLA